MYNSTTTISHKLLLYIILLLKIGQGTDDSPLPIISLLCDVFVITCSVVMTIGGDLISP
jgi:hypothetical protein